MPHPKPSPPGPGARVKPDHPPARLKKHHDLLHYAAYFLGVGSLVFVAQTDAPKQIESAVISGAIASGCVLSRDWYKARLDPSLAQDPTALITLFSEMLHAGRAQANANAAHLKRVEFLQTDLVEAMRNFNDLLRLEPTEVEQRLRGLQSLNANSAFPPSQVVPMPEPKASSVECPPAATPTHVPPSLTVRQSHRARRPGFDA